MILKRESLSEKLAKIISSQIIKNELKSGEVISETQIAKEWGTSRSPVRDALHTLEQKRLVEKDIKGRYKVVELTLDYIENFYDAANMFYQYSFLRAIKSIQDKDVKFLLSTTNNIKKSIEKNDFDTYIKEITIFARTILHIAQNPIIEQSALDFMPAVERVLYAAIDISPSHLKESDKHVRQIYENLSSEKTHNIAKAFQDFANTSRKVLLNHFKNKK